MSQIKPEDVYIFLVRHGQSETNVDPKKHLEQADWEVNLTQVGHEQARKAGEFLHAYLSQPEFQGKEKCLWKSSYQRTRQTASGVMRTLQPLINKEYESDRLREQEFGMFDGLSDQEREQKYPEEWRHFRKHHGKDGRGKYMARYPGGESGVELGDRVALFQDSLFRDINEGTPVHVVVSHGLTIRAFVKEFFHHPFEWFAKEPNPDNCSIRLLKGNKRDGYKDLGYIYTGKQEEIDAAKKAAGLSM